MKLFLILFTLSAYLSNTYALQSLPKVVYGMDNRMDSERHGDRLLREKSLSTAALIPRSDIKLEGPKVLLSGMSLKEKKNLCDGQRFSEQQSIGHCTAFLIKDDIMVTAGHCLNTSNCNSYSVAFGLKQETFNGENYILPKKDIYFCKNIIAQQLTQDGMDYAVFKLNRKVKGRSPLPFRKTDKVSLNSKIAVIGHPDGIPLKIADNGSIRKNTNSIFFTASLDTFRGNSGSPVFNQKTGLLEGVLVRGEKDYQFDANGNCFNVNNCPETGCQGEDVVRITNLPI